MDAYTQAVKTRVFEIIDRCYTTKITAENIKSVTLHQNKIDRDIHLIICGLFLQNTASVEFEYVPATWWDMFKATYFPKLKHNKRCIKKTIYHICPHLPIEPQRTHMEFLTME